MSKKKILKHNSQSFLDDLGSVRDVLVWASNTGTWFRIAKSELRRTAEEQRITYYMTDRVFVVKRQTMVIT